jgi:hypothetical protein
MSEVGQNPDMPARLLLPPGADITPRRPRVQHLAVLNLHVEFYDLNSRSIVSMAVLIFSNEFSARLLASM